MIVALSEGGRESVSEECRQREREREREGPVQPQGEREGGGRYSLRERERGAGTASGRERERGRYSLRQRERERGQYSLREREAQRGRVGRPSSTPGSLSVAAAMPAVLGVKAAVVLVSVPVRVVDVEWGRAIVVPASVPPAGPSGADPTCLGCVYV